MVRVVEHQFSQRLVDMCVCSTAEEKSVVDGGGVRVNHLCILCIHTTQQHPSPEVRMVP